MEAFWTTAFKIMRVFTGNTPLNNKNLNDERTNARGVIFLGH